MEPFLSLRHVSKTFHANHTLDDIGLDFILGEVHCLARQNGCERSTLVEIISGVYRPDEGAAMTPSGKMWSKLIPTVSVAHGIQAIYQDLSLFPNLNVWENIAINHYHRGVLVRRSELRHSAGQAVRSINVSLPLDTAVESLSIAHCQLVAICRALVQDARLIIMDEPTASLTHQEVEGLLRVVHQLCERGICVVPANRHLEEVMAVSDRISVLKDGNLVGTLPAAKVTTQRLSLLMTGQESDYQVRDLWQGKGSMPMLEVRNLCRKGEYHNVSLKVEAGEVVSAVSLLGTGRTKLRLNLFGMTRSDGGEILINGQPMRLCSSQDVIRHGISCVSEDRMSYDLVMSQSIEDNIISTVFHKVKNTCGLLSGNRAQQLVAGMINTLTIKVPDTCLPVDALSGGDTQCISVARWLAISLKLLTLDSPTVGVDITNKAGIYHIISDLVAHGVAVLMICDEIEEAWYQSHRILVMKQGGLTHNFPPDSSTQQQVAEVANG